MSLPQTEALLGKIERALDICLSDIRPPALAEAARYAALGAGKRFRPTLALLACRAVGGDEDLALPAACALELVHAYSLIHDDLPCMDDAATRRGRPSCHVAFGEGRAVLTGDALLTQAFQVLAEAEYTPELGQRLVSVLARAAGWAGMVGGQWDDLDTDTDYAAVADRKTGALIRAALTMGGLAGGASEDSLHKLDSLGSHLGRLFQVADDILDRHEASARQGEESLRRNTAVGALGEAGARSEAVRLADAARIDAQALGPDAAPLVDMVQAVLERAS